MILYPVFIAPLFDKYSPLEADPLCTSIEELAAKLKFPLAQLYVVEGSKRSAHSNAYFYGLWGSKRIVLFDTLLLNKGKPKPNADELIEPEAAQETETPDEANEAHNESAKGCEDPEVLAVLAHELGHWKLGRITKNIFIIQVQLLMMFTIFAYLFKYDPLYRSIGFPAGQRPALIGLMLIVSYVLGPFNALIKFAMTIVSRTFEYQAGAFAKSLGYVKELSKALIKLNIDNLGFPVYDWLYSALNNLHPTLLQRMERLKDDGDDETKKSN